VLLVCLVAAPVGFGIGWMIAGFVERIDWPRR
jgi:hypothetical protein